MLRVARSAHLELRKLLNTSSTLISDFSRTSLRMPHARIVLLQQEVTSCRVVTWHVSDWSSDRSPSSTAADVQRRPRCRSLSAGDLTTQSAQNETASVCGGLTVALHWWPRSPANFKHVRSRRHTFYF